MKFPTLCPFPSPPPLFKPTVPAPLNTAYFLLSSPLIHWPPLNHYCRHPPPPFSPACSADSAVSIFSSATLNSISPIPSAPHLSFQSPAPTCSFYSCLCTSEQVQRKINELPTVIYYKFIRSSFFSVVYLAKEYSLSLTQLVLPA